MITRVLAVAFVLLAGKSFSQDYLTTITQKSCECLDKVSSDLAPDDFNLQLGLCIIEAASPYKKQLKKDHDIDFNNIETDGEKLGKLIGIKMVSVCPNIFGKITKLAGKDDEPEQTSESANGIVTKIESDFFVVFSIKDDAGKVSKYYWLTFVESETDLVASYSTLMGKRVAITYESLEFFDPRIKEYRPLQILKSIEEE